MTKSKKKILWRIYLNYVLHSPRSTDSSHESNSNNNDPHFASISMQRMEKKRD